MTDALTRLTAGLGPDRFMQEIEIAARRSTMMAWKRHIIISLRGDFPDLTGRAPDHSGSIV